MFIFMRVYICLYIFIHMHEKFFTGILYSTEYKFYFKELRQFFISF